MTSQIIVDPNTDPDFAASEIKEFIVPLTVDMTEGGTAAIGFRVSVMLNVEHAAEVRYRYSVDNGATFRDRQIIDRICTNTDYRQVIWAHGTHLMVRVKNLDSGNTNAIALSAQVIR